MRRSIDRHQPKHRTMMLVLIGLLAFGAFLANCGGVLGQEKPRTIYDCPGRDPVTGKRIYDEAYAACVREIDTERLAERNKPDQERFRKLQDALNEKDPDKQAEMLRILRKK